MKNDEHDSTILNEERRLSGRYDVNGLIDSKAADHVWVDSQELNSEGIHSWQSERGERNG
jgi:hypothetical protein